MFISEWSDFLRIELNKEMRRKIIIYSCSLSIGILVFTLIYRIDQVLDLIANLITILFPFISGFAMAFILNKVVMWVEKNVLSHTKFKERNKRIVSEIIVFVIVFGLLGFAISTIIPNLLDSIEMFMKNIQKYSNTLYEYVQYFSKLFHISPEMYEAWFNSFNLTEKITTTITGLIPELASVSFTFAHKIMNFFIAVASAFYILLDKEELIMDLKKFSFSILKKSTANFLILFLNDAKIVFEQYIVGNFLDSLIVGLICYVGMLIFKIPYASMIGFFIGMTNIIPVFGPFLGAIPVTVLLLLIHPAYALFFMVFILILQQVDGNVLKPIILGDRLGMSGLWILFSVTVGGALFGVLGMFLGVPVFALLYASLHDYSKFKLEKKHIEINDEAGIID